MRDDNDSDGIFPPLYETVALETDVRNYVEATEDGRVNINLDSKLGSALRTLPPSSSFSESRSQHSTPPPYSKRSTRWNIPLNVVIQVVGSRGDVQPLIALGNELQRAGHRVRIATHDVFEALVKTAGLEFYPIGGDPAELMAYMVKNPGMIPSLTTLRKGDVQKKRAMISRILEGCWKSCIEPDIDSKKPFVAEAIIANPPSFAHIHCAQALGIPVHLIFTMPWTRTRAFPHPLANLHNMRNSSSEMETACLLSYDVVEWMAWQGLGDVINRWRKTLGLEAVDTAVGAALARELKIPFTYCWSPSLVPKPSDWPSYIDVCGFFFRDEPKYTPSADLDAFLRSEPQPVYIGFGSIVINEPEKLTGLLLEAIEMCGVRAIISRGWSKLGSSMNSKDIFYLDDCPHEWLFKHVAAVVHHGGAGTTACGLLNGCPTAIVPFFGDQPFWGEMVAAAGAGPPPIPYKSLNSQELAQAIQYCLTPEASAAAKEIGSGMRKESGVKNAVASFHRNLPFERLGCDVIPGLSAAWNYSRGEKPLKLSKEAAEILVEYGKVDEKHLKIYETNSINTDNRRWDPLTGSTSSMAGTAINMASAVGGIFTAPYETYREAQRRDADKDDRQKDSAKLASAMIKSSVKNIGMFNLSLFKGTMVDLPLAVAEGLRTAPRLYGEQVQDHGIVTDWKSGFVVAGKSFAHGMHGFSDFAMKPYEGARDEGALGFVKGVGMGTFGAAFKPCSALLGLFVYPAQGLCKTIRNATHMGTRKSIAAARRSEGAYLLERKRGAGLDISEVLARFDEESKREDS